MDLIDWWFFPLYYYLVIQPKTFHSGQCYKSQDWWKILSLIINWEGLKIKFDDVKKGLKWSFPKTFWLRHHFITIMTLDKSILISCTVVSGVDTRLNEMTDMIKILGANPIKEIWYKLFLNSRMVDNFNYKVEL